MSKRVSILGGGESGAGAAVLAKKQGFEIWVSDLGTIKPEYRSLFEKNEIPFEEGQHSEEKILQSDLVIKSPGIPDRVALVQKIREKGVELISEVEFAARYTKGRVIAITGSNGKTTTTSLIYKILEDAGLDVALGGNIGKSFAMQVAENDRDFHVVEVSSFQLDDIISFQPWIAVLMNITPDHLDRYAYKMENYVRSKFRITENQQEGDFFIWCNEDPESIKGLKKHPTKARKLGFGIESSEGAIAWIQDNTTITVNMDQDTFSFEYEMMRLQGRHNMYNTMAAAIVAKVLDVRNDTIRESLTDFRNVEHRMEPVASVGGIEFINDSKATNVNSAWYALESINKKIVWLAGGVDKGNDYKILVPLVEKKVKSIIVLGEDARKFHEAFGTKVDLILNVESMEEAVKMGYHFADKGDAVLLSPACASFDLFDNYEHRGREFKYQVKKL